MVWNTFVEDIYFLIIFLCIYLCQYVNFVIGFKKLQTTVSLNPRLNWIVSGIPFFLLISDRFEKFANKLITARSVLFCHYFGIFVYIQINSIQHIYYNECSKNEGFYLMHCAQLILNLYQTLIHKAYLSKAFQSLRIKC